MKTGADGTCPAPTLRLGGGGTRIFERAITLAVAFWMNGSFGSVLQSTTELNQKLTKARREDAPRSGDPGSKLLANNHVTANY